MKKEKRHAFGKDIYLLAAKEEAKAAKEEAKAAKMEARAGM